VTLPVPGSPGPSGAPASGMDDGDLRETYLSPAMAAGRPPWDEMPQSDVLAPPQEAPQGQSRPPGAHGPDGPEHPDAPPGRPARPGVAAPARHTPARAAVHGRVLAARMLALLGGVTMLIGLFVPYDGATFWNTAQFWTGFAAVCALVQLAPMARPVFGWSARRVWSIEAAGVAGLLLFWVLIVLPVVVTNSSFVVTAAVGAAAGGAWLGRRPPVTGRERPAEGR
jgi:hypothetical protein